MPSTRQLIREYLQSQDGPRWGCEIVAALRDQGVHLKPSRITAMAAEGVLAVCWQDGANGYSVVPKPERAPRPRSDACRANDRTRAEAGRRAAGVQPRGPASAQQPSARLKREPARRGTAMAETVAEFMARGGAVDTLPGFQNNGVHARRRPGGPAGYRAIG